MTRSEDPEAAFRCGSCALDRAPLAKTRMHVRAARVRILAPLLPLLFLAAPATARADAIWVIDTLDASMRVDHLSLAVDSLGRLHTGYRNADTGSLHYGLWDSGAWSSETVTDSGGSNSIAVTPAGDPSIAYTGWNQLRFASRGEQGWAVEFVDAFPSLGGTPSLGLRSVGLPDIGYMGGSVDWDRRFRHAKKSEGGWATELVAVKSSEEEEGEIAIGAGDLPVAAFPELHQDCPGTRLIVAELEEGAWNRETVDSGGCDYGSHYDWDVQIAARAGGRANVAYIDLYAGFEDRLYELRYERKNAAGVWEEGGIEGVWNAWYMNWNNWMVLHDLALAPDETPHVLYLKVIDSTGVYAESLLVARKMGGPWIKECVLPALVRDAAIAIGPGGEPTVLFGRYGPANGLYLARRIEATGVAGGPRPTGQLRLAVSPNPLRRGGTISFALEGEGVARGGAAGVASSSPATISIYDIRGRVMRSFETAAPFGALSWDGADASGRPLAPGVYFIRLNDGERRATARVTIVR